MRYRMLWPIPMVDLLGKKAKYLIGVILDLVLAVFKFSFHEIFVVTKNITSSELCNFMKFLLQQ